MKQYLDLEKYVLENGTQKGDRTGTGTISTFGYQMRFDLQEGFPIMTTKRVPFKLVVSELLWFLHGDTNIRYLLQHNNNIWNEWAFERFVKSDDYKGEDMTDFGLRAERDPAFKEVYQAEMEKFKTRILEDEAFANKYGELGNIYGKQWREWKTSQGETIDQLADLIEMIKTNPNSRRLIVSAWNPEDIPNMALPPCHSLFQFYVADGKLSCQLYQRSADIFLGVPFNIASYALLTHLIAREVGLEVGEFIHTMGDAHLYNNHIEQVKEQLSRTPHKLPKLVLSDKPATIFDFDVADISLDGYNPDPAIKAPISV
ncbi:thymidylate synthase [Listeria monocytogenes]|uniref:Thymidylate synthase n=3 Tax=Listeria monocytogenes TaxID=1639 RepID=TYSY_LISMH|nr:thymidylate synthase [Listeria monocytogenes]B8DDM8.1 RecName: Full=Thymidylate synthase; Short=TS; Short=TSase [Listeria monocytogenes HCC23]MCY61811.1 thymidylate synthase [Listeria monocytogenes serotype 4c]ACK39037.1 thymidylate synthase [Listeria monocytogenes HCC23]AEH92973.1 thymidylate synthase [Listeria monocytogenes M7]AKS54480.1 thymidylate synthase [Listeria monocytogenes]AYY71727.1 thymidylate synthase [Listeria monocytogenes]